jgi:hypothetical protein
MTKNEAIWQATLAFIQAGNWDTPLREAHSVVAAFENQGCAPWQDTPKPAVELDGIDVYPVYRMITEDDVIPGAMFVDSDGEMITIISVSGRELRAVSSRGLPDDPYTIYMDKFLLNRNGNSASIINRPLV